MTTHSQTLQLTELHGLGPQLHWDRPITLLPMYSPEDSPSAPGPIIFPTSAAREPDQIATGLVKAQRLRSYEGGDIAVFIEMDDGRGDVFLSGRVSPRLPASGKRIRIRLSLTYEQRWVAKNGEWLYDGTSVAAAPCERYDGARVVGVVSTIKPESSCCWITLGDFDGGVYCLNAWCPAGNLPRLGTEVSLELKLGKYGHWRVSWPPGLAVLSSEEELSSAKSSGGRRSTPLGDVAPLFAAAVDAPSLCGGGAPHDFDDQDAPAAALWPHTDEVHAAPPSSTRSPISMPSSPAALRPLASASLFFGGIDLWRSAWVGESHESATTASLAAAVPPLLSPHHAESLWSADVELGEPSPRSEPPATPRKTDSPRRVPCVTPRNAEHGIPPRLGAATATPRNAMLSATRPVSRVTPGDAKSPTIRLAGATLTPRDVSTVRRLSRVKSESSAIRLVGATSTPRDAKLRTAWILPGATPRDAEPSALRLVAGASTPRGAKLSAPWLDAEPSALRLFEAPAQRDDHERPPSSPPTIEHLGDGGGDGDMKWRSYRRGGRGQSRGHSSHASEQSETPHRSRAVAVPHGVTLPSGDSASAQRLMCRHCAASFAATDVASLLHHFASRHAREAPPATLARVRRAVRALSY